MKKSFIIALSFAACLVACQKSEPIQTSETQSGEISFTTGNFDVQVNTKADPTVVTTDNLSTFNVLCTKFGTSSGTTQSDVFNASFSGTPNTAASFKGGKYWPSTNEYYCFYASNVAITSNTGAPTVSASNTTDIVCAYLSKDNVTYKSNNSLAFSHIFARITSIEITAPSAYYIKNLSLKITPKVSGTYAIITGNGKTDGTGWSSTTAGSVTTLLSKTTQTSSLGQKQTATTNLYLVPGSYTLTVEYDLVLGEYVKHYKKTATASIVGGSQNKIATTLPAGDASEITFSVSVAAWGSNTVTIPTTGTGSWQDAS